MSKLEYLSLYNNRVSDINTLSKLTSLKKAYLNLNNIKDISPLKDFNYFEDLNVSGNPIQNKELIKHIENAVID